LVVIYAAGFKAVFHAPQFLWWHVVGSQGLAKTWISRFGMSVSGWNSPKRAAKKLQKNRIFLGKIFEDRLLRPPKAIIWADLVCSWPSSSHSPIRAPHRRGMA